MLTSCILFNKIFVTCNDFTHENINTHSTCSIGNIFKENYILVMRIKNKNEITDKKIPLKLKILIYTRLIITRMLHCCRARVN